ncbi:aspartyl/asparaginyl beta-hydroxylase domain-containing protein [Rhodanobacter denitrificans]|uniref:Aspartyl/asparaginyl beta-hydroxylase domain-containing protein n=1 Tax=Rhodanobacter denitrificans TaxID=666685 RepID=A0A368K9W4_9GAMM|nr:aspartyl/asparaginyl beta-hydroxylase domain-containing protein [Rhodanobacter denitrificans]RCS28729.1 aspartyl/asparaginyl beta-hydroxylase domain-containing protein [Rhodanobacter denitrificans]
MSLAPRLILLALFAFFALCVLLVHLRGRVRLRFDRQLVDHSAVFAPYNLLMYAFSAVPARPILDRRGFPQLDLLQANWQTIRAEALSLFDEGHIRAAAKNDDASFNSFFKQGWKRFYLKWYGEPLASAEALCPQTVALLKSIPSIKAAMFATLAPNSKLNPHRDPFAGSLRYHLGLITPNSRDCRIFVDGEEHAWGDGKDVVFDETYVHWVENKTDQTRVILFADVERPLRTRWMSAINHRVGAFMGRITASPNTEGNAEKTGFVNRLYALSRRRKGAGHAWKAAFKSRHRKLYKAGKYLGILLLIWLIFLAPWPIFR